MRGLFEALTRTSDGAFVMNQKNQVIFWNHAAERLLGYSAEQAAGRLCYEVLGGRDDQGRTLCQRYCRIAIGVAQGETPPTLDVLARTQSGEERWLNVTTFAWPTGDPEMGDVIVHLFRDATEQKSNQRLVDKILQVSRERLNDSARPGTPEPAEEPDPNPRFEALTPREQEVLLLLAHGLGTGEIADELTISPATTRNHVQRVLDKLKVHSRLEAVAYAYQRGLIDVDA